MVSPTIAVTYTRNDGNSRKTYQVWVCAATMPSVVRRRMQAAEGQVLAAWTLPVVATAFVEACEEGGAARRTEKGEALRSLIGRALIEWEAYRETLRATAELLGIEAAADPALEAHIVAQFTSAAYAFMWPFPGHVRKLVRAEIARLRRETNPR